MSRGDFVIFIDRPISAGLMVVAVLLLAWGLATSLRRRAGIAPQLAAED